MVICSMKKSECDDLISKFEKENYSFGQAMRYIRQRKELKIRKGSKEVGKTPTYISDIERDNNKPPEKELMKKILVALDIQEIELQNCLYDLAARQRGRVSEDIAGYIMEHSDLRLVIRMVQQRNDGESFWAECVKKME